MSISRDMWWRRFIISSAILSPVFLLGLNSLGMQSTTEGHCDPDIRSSGDDVYGYRLREDRCEGIYVRNVGMTTLLVASLTESFENFNPAASQNLQVDWPALGDNNVRLRAQAFRHKLYYRMDSLRPAGNNSYTWSPNLLATFNLKRMSWEWWRGRNSRLGRQSVKSIYHSASGNNQRRAKEAIINLCSCPGLN
jgi:hypothetical protein